MNVDFALILVITAVVTGVISLVDVLILRKRRVAQGQPDSQPVLVEYSRSFFPIIAIVLIVRSFLYEPFRIPSDSMMPTLLDGDFIFVNKYAYGLRLPVVNRKVLELGGPIRGDVIVFRLPSDPSTNYIKRVVGLPGDTVRYEDRRLTINGELMPVEMDGIYEGHGHTGAEIGVEQFGDASHRVLYRPRHRSREGEYVIPDGHYFLMGDNRDNSKDSRFEGVGLVPEANLVGKAVRIWMNWNIGESGPIWNRIGSKIE